MKLNNSQQIRSFASNTVSFIKLAKNSHDPVPLINCARGRLQTLWEMARLDPRLTQPEKEMASACALAIEKMIRL